MSVFYSCFARKVTHKSFPQSYSCIFYYFLLCFKKATKVTTSDVGNFMKREFEVGNFIHVYNRGNRKMPIIRDEHDKCRFLKILRFFNDEYSDDQGLPSKGLFSSQTQVFKCPISTQMSNIASWPKTWPPHKPLVKIISYCLKKNHFHLLLKEIKAGGTSEFMKKLGIGFTKFSNTKYHEVGSVFQGAYKAKVIGGEAEEDMKDIDYVDAYIQVFNPFEDYPGGTAKALKEFDKAFQCALDNPFSSLGESFGKRDLKIIDRDILQEAFPDMKTYKEFVYDALVRRHIKAILGKLTLELEE